MKSIFTCRPLTILLFLPLWIGAQTNPAADSLHTVIRTTADPTQRVKALSELCWTFLSVSLDSSLIYGKEAVARSVQLEVPSLEAQARNDYGTALLLKGQLKEAIREYGRAMEIRKQLKDSLGTAALRLKLGNCFYKAGQLDSAMEQFTTALVYYEKQNRKFEMAQVQTNIGSLYFTMGNYEKAIPYLNNAAILQEALNRPFELSNTLINLGNVYLKRKDTAAATTFYRRAESQAKAAGNQYAYSAALNNLSNILVGKKAYAEAISLATQAIDVRKTLAMDGDLSSARTTLAIAYNATGAYSKALEQLQEARLFAAANGLTERLVSIYLQMAIAFSGKNQADSMRHYINLYEFTKNEFTETEMLKTSAELETRYQTARKDADLEKSKAALHLRNVALAGICVLLVFAVIITILVFKQQRLRARQEQLARLNEQRLRISQELHDNIGTYLTFIKSAIDQPDQQPVIMKQDIRQLTDETISELRKTVWLMNNPEVSVAAFNTKLIDYYKKVPLVQVQPLQGTGSLQLGSGMATSLFRIIQEAVNNAVKHAQPQQVTISLEAGAAQLGVTVTDDGIGFREASDNNGAGIRNLRKRVQELKGSIQINGSAGNGTRLQVTLPFHT